MKPRLAILIACILLLTLRMSGQTMKNYFQLGHVKQGATQLQDPYFLAVDNNLSRLYVADQDRHRIVVHDLSGNPLASWGTYGNGDGQFRDPRGVAVAPNGDVYVTDGTNNRVQKFDSNGNFLLKWGGFGSGAGNFNQPFGIAVSAGGDVYVADANNRIQKFNGTGGSGTTWGTTGSGDGQFNFPQGIAVDGSGNVFVTDQNNSRVQKFTASGTFITKWGTSGSGDGEFITPKGIAVDGSGSVYVVDNGNSRVQKFSNAGTFTSAFGSYGTGDGQFRGPVGIALDNSSNIYASESSVVDRIQKFDNTGTFTTKWGAGTANGLFNTPREMAFDSNGNLYVVDASNNRIQKFNSLGVYLGQFGSYGTADGEFDAPTGIAIDGSNNVFIADFNNHRIQKFDVSGSFITKWGSNGSGDGQFQNPNTIATDAAGNAYVTDRYNHRVQKFDGTGSYLTQWGTNGSGDGQFQFPYGIELDGNGDVYVTDQQNRVQKFSGSGAFIIKWGASGSTSGNFNSPLGLAFDGTYIYVADQNNHRIQKFTTAGTFVSTFGTLGIVDPLQLYYPHSLAFSGTKMVVSDRYDRLKFFYALGTEPAQQPTSFTFEEITVSSFHAAVAAATGNPDGYLVVRAKGASPTGLPDDGTAYSAGDVLGDGHIVYSGPAGKFRQGGHFSGTTYHYKTFAYNGADSLANYKVSFPLQSSATTIVSPFGLVKDINETLSEGSGVFSPVTIEVNGSLYMIVNDGLAGSEIWKTDGTENGTVLVKDITSGDAAGPPTPLFMGSINGELIFSPFDVNGRELWKTNGTAAGTQLIKDINPGTGWAITSFPIANIGNPSTLGGSIFFTADDGVHGFELWKTDGTANGTTIVKDIVPGAVGAFQGTISTTVFNNNLYFFANTPDSGWELWQSDGTESGTVMVKDIKPGTSGSVSSATVTLTLTSTTFYFLADDGSGFELWRSDGTPGGTTVVVENTIATVSNLFASGDQLYFSGFDAVAGAELWTSDGSTSFMVKDIIPGTTSSFPGSFNNLNGTLIFYASTATLGRELHKSDGTSAGTVLVKDIFTGITASAFANITPLGTVYNNELYFPAQSTGIGTELWKTNGTGAGTVLVTDVFPGSSSGNPSSASFKVFSSYLFFTATDDSGTEWRKTDGVTTSLLKNINSSYATASGVSQALMGLGNEVLFGANDGVSGTELWKSDGTEVGTVRLVDANPGTASGFSTLLLKVGNTVYFTGSNSASGNELWITDGTSVGTQLVKDINPGSGTSSVFGAVEFNGKAFFSAADGGTGSELWSSDGTTGNTARVKDILVGSGSSSPSGLAATNGLLFFRASDGINGTQLWISDGTDPNTVSLTSVSGGFTTVFFNPPQIAVSNNVYYFLASDATVKALWRSDGTVAGTFKLMEEPLSSILNFGVLSSMGTQVVFYKLDPDPSKKDELWITDGTIPGTRKVQEFSTFFTVFGTFQDIYYFGATLTSGEGGELFRTDGTAQGTYLFKEFLPGTSGGLGSPLIAFQSRYYINANEGLGAALWASDGTPCGTFKVLDDPGTTGAAASTFLEVGEKLFMVVPNPDTGSELFSIDLTQIQPPQPTAISIQPQNAAICAGTPANVSVTATGTNLTYQWKRDGVDVAGATNATLSFAAPVPADAGSYTVEVGGQCGPQTSQAAVLTVNPITAINTQPASVTKCPGQPLDLTVASTGASLAYQWQKDSNPINGATAATYSVALSSASNSGSYKVEVTGACGTTTSAGAIVTINQATAITTHPERKLLKPGQDFTLTVTAVGSNLTYQWQLNSANLAGATSGSYAETNATENQSGRYLVNVSGDCGSVQSNEAKVDIFDPMKQSLGISFNGFGDQETNYRMVAVPLILANGSNTIATIFGDDLGEYNNTKWRVFRYEGGSDYTELTPSTQVSIGKGYWLLVRDQTTIDAGPGEVSMLDPHLITLSAGWNQIGNPFGTEVNWSDVLTANPGFMSKLRVYEGAWSDGTILKQFSGGMVNVGAGLELKIPRGNFVSRKKEPAAPNPINGENWDLVLHVVHGAATYPFAGVGMSPGATDTSYDGYDEYNLPTFLNYVEVRHPFSFAGFACSKSIVRTQMERTWEFMVASNQHDPRAKISWDNSYFGTNDRELFLQDLENDMAVDMRNSTHYEFSFRQGHRFRIAYGNREFVEKVTLPETAALKISPNPFSAEFSVGFSVPGDSQVNIDVLDNHGRKVERLVSSWFRQGRYSVQAVDANNQWSPGLYIIRMTSEKTTIYQKTIKQP